MGAYSAPHTPIAGFNGREWGRKGKGAKDGKGRGRKKRGWRKENGGKVKEEGRGGNARGGA